MILRQNKFARYEIDNATKTASLYIGKSKKPKLYRSHDLDLLIQTLDKYMQNIENNSLELAAIRQKRNEARKKAQKYLLENLKVGQFLRHTWGSTMQRVHYYQVLSINKDHVELTGAISKHSDKYGRDGTLTLVGECPNKEILTFAKIKLGEVRIKGSMHHWDTLKLVEIGDSCQEWSD